MSDGIIKIRKPAGETLFKAVLAGDLCPQGYGRKTSRNRILAPLFPFLDDAELRIVQWETPLAEREMPIPKSGPNLNSPPESVDIIRAAGFNVALLANNHIGDHGPDAVLETMEHLHRYGIRTVGAGKDPLDAEQPLELRINGSNIRILNFCEHEFGTVGENIPGSAPLHPFRNCRAIRKAAAEADFVITALHGGHEYNPFPSPRLQELCREFADAGSDLVFNCHTHCPEGIELHHDKPIIYSPGNLYFPKNSCTNILWQYGYLTKALFDKRGIHALALEPYRFDEDQVSPLLGSRREAFFRYLKTLSDPLADSRRMQELFAAWCSRYGKIYFENAVSALPENWRQTGNAETNGKYLAFRNVFTCESHNDLVRSYLKLVAENRLEEAGRFLPQIEALQNPEWAR